MGIAAEPAVWSEDLTDEVRRQLLAVDGVLVWVDPISTASGERRGGLDDLLREVAGAGIFVSTHPDVTAKMGVKAVLHTTRELGWGTDTAWHQTQSASRPSAPGRLAADPRVLKQNRGNGGIGVWKVEIAPQGNVRVQEAKGGSEPAHRGARSFRAERAADFDVGDGLVDQPVQARHLEGMVRCYMSVSGVVGFGHQLVRALAPAEARPGRTQTLFRADRPTVPGLRALMERTGRRAWRGCSTSRLTIFR